MNKRKWTVTIKLEEATDNTTTASELHSHVAAWLTEAQIEGKIKKFNVESSMDFLTENYERNMRSHRNQ